MLLERAYIDVREGEEEAFAAMMKDRAGPLLAGTPGVRSVRWGRGVESPGKFMLLVEWENMAAHEAYSRSEGSGELRKLLGTHAVGGAMEHFEMR